MNVEFFDHQDRAHPLNGAKLATAADLSSLRGGPPFFCELIGENGFTLLRGVGDDFGCVQHSSCEGVPPYLMATTHSVFDLGDCVPFLTGDTSTPVPRYHCLLLAVVRQIANHFVEIGERQRQCALRGIQINGSLTLHIHTRRSRAGVRMETAAARLN